MSRLRRWLRLWFTFELAVDRRAYIASGLTLSAIKYAGDVALVGAATGRFWRPSDYLSPVSSLVSVRLEDAPPALLPVLALWALPFLWIGVSMSMRRALGAGRSAWLALLFFVPLVSYVFMLVMAVLPSRPAASRPHEPPRAHEHRLPKALLAMAVGAFIGIAMLGITVFGLAQYGISLFLGTPFVMGALTAFLFNRRYPASESESQQVVLMTLALVGGFALLSAAEGAICLIMAAPLAIAIAAMGALLGRRIALRDRGAEANALLALALLPALTAVDARLSPTSGEREVRSTVVIDAPPDEVWRWVIAFPELAPPRELVFRAGIAYPVRAEIVGEGVGAVRYCVFSTGSFVEPITHWEPGSRLAFDVAEQPPPMQEWSPYASISPPHLDGWLSTRRGEFRLVPLSDGRTRLEGSTWYEMRLAPAAYWVVLSDALISRIHLRVLRHVKETVERAP